MKRAAQGEVYFLNDIWQISRDAISASPGSVKAWTVEFAELPQKYFSGEKSQN